MRIQTLQYGYGNNEALQIQIRHRHLVEKQPINYTNLLSNFTKTTEHEHEYTVGSTVIINVFCPV